MTDAPARKPRRGDVLEVELHGLDVKGRTIGRAAGHTVRVRGAAPGARVRVTVRKRRRSDVEASVDEVLDPGPLWVEPRCAHFGTCGGCSFQSIDYPAQLVELGRVLRETLSGLGELPVEPVLGARDPWHYRNKMDFSFGAQRWVEEHEPEGASKDFALGLHVPGRFDKVLDVAACDIAFAEATPILNTVRELALERGLDAWNVREHHGLLRHLLLRKGFATGEILLDLVTTERAAERIDPFVESVLARHPEITTAVQRVESGVALVARGEEHVLHGPGFLHEVVGGLRFRISAASFFQTNTAQTEALVELVLRRAAVRPGVRLFDLYCGSGLFSLALARRGARVTGYELVEEAVADARANAERNGIEDVRFVAGDLLETLALDRLEDGPPEVCVIDPPRAGLHAKVLEVVCALAPERIVLVSCNPKSGARDLEVLVREGYRITHVEPIDLFPHTPHLECVFTLERSSS